MSTVAATEEQTHAEVILGALSRIEEAENRLVAGNILLDLLEGRTTDIRKFWAEFDNTVELSDEGAFCAALNHVRQARFVDQRLHLIQALKSPHTAV